MLQVSSFSIYLFVFT